MIHPAPKPATTTRRRKAVVANGQADGIQPARALALAINALREHAHKLAPEAQGFTAFGLTEFESIAKKRSELLAAIRYLEAKLQEVA